MVGAAVLDVPDWALEGPERVAGHASLVCHQAQGWEATAGSPVRWVGIRSNLATQSPQDDRVLRGRRC